MARSSTVAKHAAFENAVVRPNAWRRASGSADGERDRGGPHGPIDMAEQRRKLVAAEPGYDSCQHPIPLGDGVDQD